MSKVVTSPVKHFFGTVTLKDPLFYKQCIAVQEAINATSMLPETATELEHNGVWIPAILECAEEWHLQNFPEHPTFETFPLTPRAPSIRLIVWLIKEIGLLYEETEEPIPNI